MSASGGIVRTVLRAAAVFVGVLLLLAGAAVVALATADLRPLIERVGSRLLERPLRIGALDVHWGRYAVVEARDVVLANAAWGSAPDMLTIGRLSATVDLVALLRGTLRYETLRVADATLLLERAADRRANWTMGGATGGQAKKKSGGLALVPANRGQFPVLLDLALANGRVLYRRSGSPDIDIGLTQVGLVAAGESGPVRLSVEGSYDGAAVTVTGTDMGSLDDLRDTGHPYKAPLTIVAPGATATLDARIDEPLDFDGVAGPLRLEAASLARFLAAFGIGDAPDIALDASGQLRRDGGHWRLEGLDGAIAKDRFAGSVGLDEGDATQPDRLQLDLGFPAVDLQPVLARVSAAPSGSGGGPGLRLDGDVRVATVVWRRHRLNDVALRFVSGDDGSQAVAATFGVLGGRGELRASLGSDERAAPLTVEAHVAGADVAAVASELGLAAGALTGRLHAKASGVVRGGGLAGASGQGVLWVERGAVSRVLLQKVSTDLLALFKDPRETVPITCFVARADLQAGLLRLQQLRLRAGGVQVDGRGLADLRRNTVDLVLQPHGGGVLALDRPLAIRGPLSAPSIGPAAGETVRLPALPRPPPGTAGRPCS